MWICCPVACRKLCRTTVILLYTSMHTWHFTYLLTPSKEQSPSWVANQFSASQQIFCILWKPKVHYRIYECLPCIPIVSHIDPGHASAFQFFKIQLNIIPPSMPESSKQSLSLRYPHQNPAETSPVHALPNLICLPKHYWVRITDHASFCGFLHSPITSSLLGPNVLLNTLFSNTISLHSSLNVKDQV